MSGIYGADVSSPMSVEAWRSLVTGRSVSFGIVRCYESSGRVNPSATGSVVAAWEARVPSVDVYHFPSLAVGAAAQVQAAVGALQKAGARFGRYWFDVEAGAGWSKTNLAANAVFLRELIQAAEALGLSVGVYTSAYEWSTIMDCGGFSQYPLWYAQYQTPPEPNFAGFTPFGGWTAPAMKQFAGNSEYAGICFDGNWGPGTTSQ